MAERKRKPIKKAPIQTSIPIPASDIPGYGTSTRIADEIYIRRRVRSLTIKNKRVEIRETKSDQ